ncbi:MAG: dTDP-4-dehydrorhamnose reductase, partial [uncultured Nocardioides sp.]
AAPLPGDHAHPRAGGGPARPARGRARLLQGELAAPEDAGAGPARLRPGAEQRLVQRRPRRHARHPHRAVGQVRVPGHRPDLRRLGRHARGRHLRCHLHPRDGQLGGRLRAPRGRQLLPDAGGRHLLHLPGQPALAPRHQLSRARARRPDGGDPVADPPRRGDRLRQGPHQPRARPRHRDPPPGARPGRQRAGGAGAEGGAARGRGGGPRPARPHRRRVGGRLALGRLRRRAERRGVHRRRRRGDPRGPGRRLGRQRHRTRHARRARPRARLHPRALLLRVRLRRDRPGRARAHRGRAALPARRVRPEQGSRRAGGGRRTPPLRPARLVGDRRGRQLRAHHAAARRRWRVTDRRQRPGGPTHLRRRAGAGDPPPGRLRGAVRHLPREQRRSGHVVGRRGRQGLRALRTRRGRRHADHLRGVRRGQGARAAAAAQHDGPHQAARHRLRARGRAGGAGALLQRRTAGAGAGCVL